MLLCSCIRKWYWKEFVKKFRCFLLPLLFFLFFSELSKTNSCAGDLFCMIVSNAKIELVLDRRDGVRSNVALF